MTHAFGRGDRFAIVNPVQENGILTGGELTYTDPSFDWYFSDHGFAAPLDLNGIPYGKIMDDDLPLVPAHMDRRAETLSWLLVDAKANLWKVSITLDHTDPKYSQYYIHNDGDGWWITLEVGEQDVAINSMHGFLAANPTENQISTYWSSIRRGETLAWFSIKEIAERLNREFDVKHPAEKKDALIDALDVLKGIALNRQKNREKV